MHDFKKVFINTVDPDNEANGGCPSVSVEPPSNLASNSTENGLKFKSAEDIYGKEWRIHMSECLYHETRNGIDIEFCEVLRKLQSDLLDTLTGSAQLKEFSKVLIAKKVEEFNNGPKGESPIAKIIEARRLKEALESHVEFLVEELEKPFGLLELSGDEPKTEPRDEKNNSENAYHIKFGGNTTGAKGQNRATAGGATGYTTSGYGASGDNVTGATRVTRDNKVSGYKACGSAASRGAAGDGLKRGKTGTISIRFPPSSVGAKTGVPVSRAGIGHRYDTSLRHRPAAIDHGSARSSAKLSAPFGGHNFASVSIRDQIMYHCKFGLHGSEIGCVAQPSGVAVNAQNDIIVADSVNFRMQIFDSKGQMKHLFQNTKFYKPYQVAVMPKSNNIVICEGWESEHQLLICDVNGNCVNKFGWDLLKSPRAITVDNNDRIIVVESKIMRVFIFDAVGNVLSEFRSTKELNFPTSVAVNAKENIFICDNHHHCVKVFDYQGKYLRQISNISWTKHPISVAINVNNEVVIVDNSLKFNVTIFTQEGEMVAAFNSRAQHKSCYDMAILDKNNLILACNDPQYHLYVYRYKS